jgi:predicted GIY-YIG superfamily endonuclease
MWHCYCLVNTDPGRQRTYVGATTDPARRLRQHNGELVGGARATQGKAWRRCLLVGGFGGEREALRFEWWWKRLSRGAPGSPLEARLHALSGLMADWSQQGYTSELVLLEESI